MSEKNVPNPTVILWSGNSYIHLSLHEASKAKRQLETFISSCCATEMEAGRMTASEAIKIMRGE